LAAKCRKAVAHAADAAVRSRLRLSTDRSCHMTWEHAEEAAKPVLKCPLCSGTEFDRQQGRMDSRWGITSHKLVLQICRRCGLVLQFSAGRGIFDFD
jgi:uncharacterized protein